jgi:hypothetical protein
LRSKSDENPAFEERIVTLVGGKAGVLARLEAMEQRGKEQRPPEAGITAAAGAPRPETPEPAPR